MNKSVVRICADDQGFVVDIDDLKSLEHAMRFKAEHIKAKADPELFVAVADALRKKHGHWIKMGELDGEINGCKAIVVHNQCSSCLSMTMSSFVAFRPIYKYCPYCGAKMDEVSE